MKSVTSVQVSLIVIALLLGGIATSLFSRSAWSQVTRPDRDPILPQSVGRYQLTTVGTSELFELDTATGRLWHHQGNPEAGRWEEVGPDFRRSFRDDR